LFGISSKPKIKVDVINESGLKTRKYPIEGNTIIIRAAKRGRGGAAYKVNYDKNCLLPYYVGFWPFKRLKQKLMLIEGADECVSFHFTEDGAQVDTPTWSRKSLEDASEASVIKAAGATFQKLKIPTLLYLALFMSIGMQFLTLMVLTGRVRI